MNAVTGIYHNGHVTFATPPDWQEGATVRVELESDYVGVGMREEDFPLEGERLAEWMRKADALEPFMTPEEDERWRAALKEDREHGIANLEREYAEAAQLFR